MARDELAGANIIGENHRKGCRVIAILVQPEAGVRDVHHPVGVHSHLDLAECVSVLAYERGHAIHVGSCARNRQRRPVQVHEVVLRVNDKQDAFHLLLLRLS